MEPRVAESQSAKTKVSPQLTSTTASTPASRAAESDADLCLEGEDAAEGSMLQQVLDQLSAVRKTVEMLEFNQQAMERERRQHAQQSSACCIS